MTHPSGEHAATVARLRAERDAARAIAVQLEQEVAHLRRQLYPDPDAAYKATIEYGLDA